MAASRAGCKIPRQELLHGVPVFLEQIIDRLRLEQRSEFVRHNIDARPDPDVAPTATLHGGDLLHEGFTIEQVIRDYGDVCQAVTGLAVETGASISAQEFHTFNRCLDDAIAAAVTEYSQQNSQIALAKAKAAVSAAQHEARAARLRALHDSLTGLPNRELFDDRLAHAIALADRHDWTLAVLFLDLDEFKHINDAYGHAVGDAVLKKIAQRLLHYVREEDTVCRTGGDEFLYLLMNPRRKRDIEHIAKSVLQTISQSVAIAGTELAIKPSIGIAIYPEHGATGDQLITNADAAMYSAKKRGLGIELFESQNSQGMPA
jgi:diguanylate cyclase (GGDEF)-like protein